MEKTVITTILRGNKMERLILLTIMTMMFFLIISCDMQIEKVDLPEELYKCKNYYEIGEWISTNIKYIEDNRHYGGRDYWASPERTLSSRKGDCEDFAILFSYLCRVLLDKDVKIIFARDVYQNKGHAFNKIGGRYIDPQTNEKPSKFLNSTYVLTEYNFDYIYALTRNNNG